MFKGSQGRTAFSSSVQDATSEITTVLKETSTSVAQFPDQYDCTTSSGTPVISPPAAPAKPANQGSNTGCVVLGTSLKPVIGKSELDTYTVVGCQYANCDNVNKPDPTTLASAKPTTNPSYLKRIYNLDAATIISSKVGVTAADTDSYLVGYYVNSSGSPVSGSGTLLQAYGYGGFISNGSDSSVQTCIENSCGLQSGITRWKLCFQSPYDNSKYATLTVNSSGKGVSTIVKYEDCS